jgi:hypothetical protein
MLLRTRQQDTSITHSCSALISTRSPSRRGRKLMSSNPTGTETLVEALVGPGAAPLAPVASMGAGGLGLKTPSAEPPPKGATQQAASQPRTQHTNAPCLSVWTACADRMVVRCSLRQVEGLRAVNFDCVGVMLCVIWHTRNNNNHTHTRHTHTLAMTMMLILMSRASGPR